MNSDRAVWWMGVLLYGVLVAVAALIGIVVRELWRDRKQRTRRP